MGWSSSIHSRIFSSLHSVTVSLMALRLFWILDWDLIWDVSIPASGPWVPMLQLSQIYFVLDAIFIFVSPSSGDLVWYLHHFAGFMGATLILMCRTGLLVGIHFELTELSTLFLNCYWYGIKTNRTSSRFFKFCLMCLGTTFYLTRWGGSIVLWTYLFEHLSEILALQTWKTVSLLGFPGILTALNVWWGVKLARKFCN